MSEVRTNSITDAAGTGAPDFPNGINSAGNIGLEGTTPAIVFAETDTTDLDARVRLQGGDLLFETVTDANVLVRENMRIDSSGNVGIGTSSPADVLDVAAAADGGIRLTDSTNEARFCQITQSAARLTLSADPTNAVATSFINFLVDATERMRIDSSGSVGIGTTSPDFPLDVSSTGVGSTIVSRFYVTDNTVGLLRVANSTTGDGSTAPSFGSNGTDAVIHTNNTEKLRVTSGGVLQFNSGYGSVAPAYGCRAWVNFNGTGTVAIRGSGNVSSITDLGTGAYRVNFATGMPDANYAVATSGEGYTLGDAGALQGPSTYSLSTSSFSLACGSNTNSRGGDWPTVSAVVFR